VSVIQSNELISSPHCRGSVVFELRYHGNKESQNPDYKQRNIYSKARSDQVINLREVLLLNGKSCGAPVQDSLSRVFIQQEMSIAGSPQSWGESVDGKGSGTPPQLHHFRDKLTL